MRTKALWVYVMLIVLLGLSIRCFIVFHTDHSTQSTYSTHNKVSLNHKKLLETYAYYQKFQRVSFVNNDFCPEIFDDLRETTFLVNREKRYAFQAQADALAFLDQNGFEKVGNDKYFDIYRIPSSDSNVISN